ncbi:MAG: hypothetical protein J5940_06865 [Clostridia bacterium]|nr:hypothetical protein [Clostridia bacterium]
MSDKRGQSAVIATIIKGNTSYNDRKDSGIRRPFPFATVIVTLLCTVMLMFTVYTYVSVSELRSDVSDLQKQVKVLNEDESKLQSDLNARYAEIRKKADTLGMEAATFDKVYMDAGKKDDYSIAMTPEENTKSAFGTLLSAVGQNWEKFVEFMD